jgi:myo-inositol-1(or 4)-monophosphatase
LPAQGWTVRGGLVGDFKGDEGYLEGGDIVCGNPKVFAQMIATIAGRA